MESECFDESCLDYGVMTIVAFCRSDFVVRDSRIGIRDAVEDHNERDFRPFRIAMFAGFDQLFRFTQGSGVNDNHGLFYGRFPDGSHGG
jgi:hypothetical protein